MKPIHLLVVAVMFSFAGILSCKTTSNVVETKIAYDPVCGHAVNKAESYDYKYGDTLYFFDSYACRESFKVAPESFIYGQCVRDDASVDLVCGQKVNLTESYDHKYKGRVYHFHSRQCQQNFKADPEKFIKNICDTTGVIPH